MGIYFRDILLIRISRGANNCGQHSLEKNIYFIMRFSPHFQLFYFNDRLEFCEFIEWKIKRINNADLFSQPPLLIFIKGANISGGHYSYFNDKFSERIAWKSASNARAQIKQTRSLSVRYYMCALKKYLLSNEFNVAISATWSVGIQRQKHKLAHTTNVSHGSCIIR